MAHTSSSADGFGVGAAPAGAHDPARQAASADRSSRSKGLSGRELPDAAAAAHQRIELLYRAVEKFGLPVVLLGIVLWWARNDLIEPLMNAHFDFIDTIKASHNEHTTELRGINDKLEELIKVSRE